MMRSLLFVNSLFMSMLLFSCSSGNFDKETISTVADSQSATGLTGDSVKLIKTAGMNFKVKDVFESSKALSHATRAMDGFVSDRNVESIEEETKTLKIKDDSVQVITSYIVKGDLTVRVPAEKLDDFLEQASETAIFINKININIEDKSLQYLASRLKQQHREQLTAAEAEKKHSANEGIALMKPKDQAIDQQVTNHNIDAGVKYSTVQLNFYQNALIKKETRANNNLSEYKLPFKRGMHNAFFNGWKYFLSFIIGVTHLWMFITAAAAILLAVRYYKLRKANLD